MVFVISQWNLLYLYDLAIFLVDINILALNTNLVQVSTSDYKL